MKQYEPHILRLLEVDGFIAFYLELLPYYSTCEEAYEATERQFEMAYGKRKYNDYSTFRVVLSRQNKPKSNR